ncbi:hypothetical protein M427DRAFT_31399 [Gonapodya prolifera JEL478]|uniref:SWIRM domain-containing protein n=1 Tax=Gonapodya prolifera (strain JEL478) TaxID=1344416 RepID=A0A139AHF3_GONPJ|nr:hypothetical protein M427DRAFT_31399 [Gonapodya prolifera JEL478]|eukprot:KXS16227.1 hypothetical protein M427DRAFT_31399 [Gonapodya prolifera JEL478]
MDVMRALSKMDKRTKEFKELTKRAKDLENLREALRAGTAGKMMNGKSEGASEQTGSDEGEEKRPERPGTPESVASDSTTSLFGSKANDTEGSNAGESSLDAGAPFRVEPSMVGYYFLDPAEIHVCEKAELFPTQYLHMKDVMMSVRNRYQYFRKSDAREWFDVPEQSVNKVYDFFVSLKLIDPDPLEYGGVAGVGDAGLIVQRGGFTIRPNDDNVPTVPAPAWTRPAVAAPKTVERTDALVTESTVSAHAAGTESGGQQPQGTGRGRGKRARRI